VTENVEGTSAQWRALGFLALAELLGMTLWFSASAVVPTLEQEWGLSSGGVGWLTSSVQIGFVVGTFVAAFLNLPDIVSSRRLLAASALLGAVSNAAFAVLANDLWVGIPLRFLTGVFLAGVYPPGMKLAATWSLRYRGVAVGLLVGALTIGSASPHLVRSLTDIPWRQVVLLSSVLSVAGGAIVLTFVREGPFSSAPAPFDPRMVFRLLAERGTRLANLGYLGHMWELYAMWTWVPVFLVGALEAQGRAASLAGVVAFSVIAVGGLGSIAGGVLADRLGRTAVTSAAMVVSGTSALTAALLFDASLWLLTPVLLVWGFTVVADSAQFSAAITELSPPQYVGTSLTMQTAMGFLLTLFSIQLVPFVVDSTGWSLAFAMLALGPVVGVAAMLRLRSLPESIRLAGGRR
jgi:MFS family permease|tara:strand:+ start:10212 stop:11432 length:1221 start_codon:yes stop_codon:yes gene_type:complete